MCDESRASGCVVWGRSSTSATTAGTASSPGAAWGTLEGCGWQRAIDGAGEMVDKRGRVRPKWATAFRDAVERLAEEGGYAGPEGDEDRWASWVCFEIAEPRAVIEAIAVKRGWDR